MNFPKVFIIILNWNGMRDTLECLESVFKLDYENFEVAVVDNGSIDDSVTIVKRDYPKVELIGNEENLGFAAGNNVGIRYAMSQGAEYIWLLNNDTIVNSDALSNMIEETERDPEIGIAGSKIYYYGSLRKIWFTGAKIDWLKGVSNHIGMGEIDVGQYDYIKDVDRVTGCSMLVKKDVCNKVGLLDEKFFLYVEEVDWCVRARKAGFKCIFVPSSVVYHKESSSVARIGIWNKVFSYYNTRNFLYMIKKTFSFPIREIILLLLIIRKLKNEKVNCLKMFLSSVNSSSRLEPTDAPFVFAVRDFLKKKMGKVDYKFS